MFSENHVRERKHIEETKFKTDRKELQEIQLLSLQRSYNHTTNNIQVDLEHKALSRPQNYFK